MFILSSCNSNIRNSAINAVTPGFKDGTYIAFGDSWEYGNESAVITIKNHIIQTVTLHKHETNGLEVDYELWDGSHGRPNLKESRLIMAKKMLEAQNSHVPNISGAAISSENWKLAFNRALSDAL